MSPSAPSIPAAFAAVDGSPATSAGIASKQTADANPLAPRGIPTDPAPSLTRTTSPRVAIVVPSNRPAHLQTWLTAWAPFLVQESRRLYIVEDAAPTWQRIRDDLGERAWVIPRRTDCIRMWGYLQALRDGADIIVTMDDDCLPHLPALDAFGEHVRALTTLVEPVRWGRTLDSLATRGLPATRRVAINHGLWMGVPDVSGATQLAGYRAPTVYPLERILDVGTHYPLSGMNLAWWAEWTPALFFGGMGDRMDREEPWGLHRFGDIFAGLLAKQIVDMRGGAIRNGTPFVEHVRASDPVVNEQRERAGAMWLERFAYTLRTAALRSDLSIEDNAIRLTYAVRRLDTPYWDRYALAWSRWIDLCREARSQRTPTA